MSNILKSTKSLIIYHGNCDDGFGACLSAWQRFGLNADYIPSIYGEAPPDVAGYKEVFIVDTSFSPDVMVELAKNAFPAMVTLLDHHESAERALMPLKNQISNLELFFDLNRSGAMIAWEFFNPGRPVPRLIKIIQDIDLWSLKIPESRDFSRAIRSYGRSINLWGQWLNDEALDSLLADGVIINRAFKCHLKEISEGAKPVVLSGSQGLMVNANHVFTSELGCMLAQQSGTFALLWREEKNRIVCSLRGVAGFEVNRIAERFGGGGHQSAASFRMSSVPELFAMLENEKIHYANKKYEI